MTTMTGQRHQVTTADGRWPTTWDTAETATIVAEARRRLEALPRSPDTFRGEHCWLAPTKPGEDYPRLPVGKTIAALMGLSTAAVRRRAKAHRISFFVFNGHRPTLGTVDHACNRKNCVNPAHLDDMTIEDNRARRDPYANWTNPRRK